MKNKQSTKVLQVTGTLGLNGLTSVAMNFYRNIDVNKFHFDFAFFKDRSDEIVEEITNRGGNLYDLNNNRSTPKSLMEIINFIKSLYKLIKVEKYDAVHSHVVYLNGLISLIAWFAKVPVRVVHSHNDSAGENGNSIARKFVRAIEKKTIRIFSTDMLACSEKSAFFMYGNKCFNDKRVSVINNAVNLDVFNYNNKKHNKTKLYKFIFVGRYDPQKNPVFLIRTFYELLKIRQDISLTLIGRGGLEVEMLQLINDLDISCHITLVKPNNRIHEYLSDADFFVLPSIYEGLPVVLVEAQAMGLSCFISDNITKEVDLGICHFIPLAVGEKGWADYINNSIENANNELKIDSKKLEEYDIKKISRKIEKIYNK